MGRLTRAAIVAAFVCGGAQSASAAVFSFSYTTTTNGVARATSGTLFTTNTTTTNAGRQAYTILGVTGRQGTANIDRLLPSGSTDATFFNNLLYTSGSYFDINGFGFQAAGTTKLTNIYYESGYREFVGGPGEFDAYSISRVSNFTLVQTAGSVPEASTWAMMILGLGACGAALRRRVRSLVAA